MKRLSYFLTTALLMAGLSVSARSQSQKPPDPSQKAPDPCAQFKTAPKGESAADKKKRQADLKTCTDNQKAESKASKAQAPKK
jgi:hypothetical protein